MSTMLRKSSVLFHNKLIKSQSPFVATIIVAFSKFLCTLHHNLKNLVWDESKKF